MSKILTFDPPERSRTYVFADKSITMWNVTAVYISDSGTHYINHGKNGCLRKIIRCGWLAIDLDIDKWTYPEDLNFG